MTRIPIVELKTFIEATRETGYKSTGSAIAEFIDNALQAEAKRVAVCITQVDDRECSDVLIKVTDDGTGMMPEVLRIALQFGGSTRFGSRAGTGRYGMGLPNGALSQARRVEIYTWTEASAIWTTHLDIDEIISGNRRLTVPHLAENVPHPTTQSGTVVVLKRCDRVDSKNIPHLTRDLINEFGRIFRKSLQAGRRITVNGSQVGPIDPLFIEPGANSTGAKPFGPVLEYKIRVPQPTSAITRKTSTVAVLFSELPLDRWHSLSNEEKNELGISKRAGVSIVRAGREIDYGWYFMGSKRKENYDDWWRCEINFAPELDELFGVTHSKQKINPTALISSILSPEIERIARELNSRVRTKYSAIKSGMSSCNLKRFQVRDHLLDPPPATRRLSATKVHIPELKLLRKRNDGVNGLSFALTLRPENHNDFFSSELRKGVLSLNINQCHPFYSGSYRYLIQDNGREFGHAAQHVLMLLISFARAEFGLSRPKEREIMRRFRRMWSDTVAAYLS